MFSRFFIYRPVFALVIAIVIVILGTISIPTLPVESMPDITPPTVSVSTTFPGAGAQVVELGPVNASIHSIDEHVSVEDLETLSRVYERILEKLLL